MYQSLHPLSFSISPFFRNMQPLLLIPFMGKYQILWGYHDTVESGRLEAINIRPWKSITNRNCVPSVRNVS